MRSGKISPIGDSGYVYRVRATHGFARGVMSRNASFVITLAFLTATNLPLGWLPAGLRHPSSAGPVHTYTSSAYPMQFNPNSQFSGGAGKYVMTSPHIYLVFWGPQWNDTSTKDSGNVYTNAQARNILTDLFTYLGGSPWADTVTQYCQGPGVSQGSVGCASNSTYITNPLGFTAWYDSTNPLPSAVTNAAAAGEAQRAYNQEGGDTNGVYMIFTPSGVPWSLSNGCAWHSYATQAPYVTFSVVPYQPDQSGSCYGYTVNPAINPPSTGGHGDGWFDGLTITAAHEYAENVTDPYHGGWYDSTGATGEIGDKCGVGLNPLLNSGQFLVDYAVPLGNVWLGSYYYAIQGNWSNGDAGCVIPFDNANHLYLLDGYGGIHPSGTAPALSSPDYAGYDIARGLAFFGGATGGYWMDGYAHLHPVGNVQAANSVVFPSFGIDIARSIWPAPWSTPNHPAGYILDGYGGINRFYPTSCSVSCPVPTVSSPHYTAGTDIARAVVINEDQFGTSPVAGYMLDGYGTAWPLGTAPNIASPQFGTDIARGIVLLPKTTTSGPGGYILDGQGGMHPFGVAPTLTNSAYFTSDIARGATSWTYATTSWRYRATDYVGGWVIDGYGGLHYYQSAPNVGSNVYWQNWDIARADTGSESGSGAR